MAKSRTTKRKHASRRKLANKSFNKQIKRQKNRKKEGKNTRGDASSVQNSYISQNIERTNFNALNNHGLVNDNLSEEQLDTLLEKSNKAESTFASLSNGTEDSIEGKKRKRKQPRETVEEYEKLPRKLPKHYIADDVEHLLPIKGKDGIITQTKKVSKEEDLIEDTNVGEHTEQEEVLDSVPKVLSVVQLLAERHHRIMSSKSNIAEICQAILGNPEEKVGQLKSLISLCQNSELPSVRKMAILSASEVFKDIVPGYRIRPLTENEKNVKVSKDVKRLRDFEETLISSYRKYLDILEEAVNDGIKAARNNKGNEDEDNNSAKAQVSLGILSIQCMADLLTNLPHFNYRTNIIACMIPKMDLGGKHEEIVNICFKAIKEVFRNDMVGDLSLEIVKLISKYTKPKIKKVHPVLIDVFVHLNIDPELIKGAEQTDNKLERLKKRREEIRKMSRMEKKRKKLEEKLNKELKETEAFESHSKIQKLHTEILKFVFVIYFRVVKVGRRTPLLASALRGLSKFAYLINVDFFQDLMRSLQYLMSSENLSMSESINCALTALKILTGQGEALTVDPHQFYLHIYSVLWELSSATDDDIALCCECLQLMLVKRRKQVSFQRLIGFLKRLTTTSLQLSTDGSIALLNLSKSILQLNRRCDCLLENESIGRGVFRPDLPDPEHCNADSTSLWELCLTGKHYCTEQREFSRHILRGAPSHGPEALRPQSSKKLSNWKTDHTKLDSYFPASIPTTASIKPSRRQAEWNRRELDHSFEKTLKFADEREKIYYCCS